MSRSVRTLAAVFSFAFAASIFCLAPVQSVWADPAPLRVIGISGNETATDDFAQKNHMTVWKLKGKTHADGNSQVDLVASKEVPVVVLLPPKMNSEQAIEALLKIRSAKAMGATSVHIASPVPLSQLEFVSSTGNPIALQFEPLIQEAGADTVGEAGEFRKLPSARAKLPPRRAPENNYFMTSEPSDLAENIQLKTWLPTVPSGAQSLKNSRVFLLNGRGANSNDRVFETISDVQGLKARGADVFLISPYLLYARSDKPESGDTTITAGRLVADLLEVAGTDEIAFVRAHAPQSSGFFRIPSHNLVGRPTLNSYIRSLNIDLVVSPDNGAAKEATLHSDELGKNNPLVLNKQRNRFGKSVIKMSALDIRKVKDKTVVIIDDETASGGSLAKAAAMLKEAGATKVVAVVTHINGLAQDAVASDKIDELVFTNTMKYRGPASSKIKVLDASGEISDLLKETIYRGAVNACERKSVKTRLKALAH